MNEAVWEVDTDCDGAVSLAEFEEAYNNSHSDKKGFTPRKLFMLACFLMADDDNSGTVPIISLARMLRHMHAALANVTVSVCS